jgi:hypothetical protein
MPSHFKPHNELLLCLPVNLHQIPNLSSTIKHFILTVMISRFSLVKMQIGNMFMRGFLFYLSCFISSKAAFAQKREQAFSTTKQVKEVNYTLSFVPIHAWMHAHNEFVEVFRGTTGIGFQIDLNRYRQDKSAFEFFNIKYTNGYSLQYVKYSNENLGQVVNLGYFLEPILIDQPKFSLGLRATASLNYASNPWSEYTNPENNAYSLLVNNFLGIGLQARFILTNHQSLNAFASYGHISNGNTNSPNSGLNYPFIGVGYEQYLFQRTHPNKKDFFYPQRWRLDLGLMMSNKSLPNFKSMRFWVYGITANASYRTGNLHAWTVGMEAFRDESIAFALNSNRRSAPYGFGVRLGLLGGHEFLMNRWIFSQQLGYYLYDDVFTPAVYQRFGINYKITKQVFVGLNTNTTFPKAYTFEARLSYSFYKKSD